MGFSIGGGPVDTSAYEKSRRTAEQNAQAGTAQAAQGFENQGGIGSVLGSGGQLGGEAQFVGGYQGQTSVPKPNPGISFAPPQQPQQPQFGGGVQPLQGDFNLQNPGMGEWAAMYAMQNLQNPGQGEQYLAGAIPGITAPGAGQQWYDTYGSQIMGNAAAGNPVMQAYQQFLSNRPDISAEPGLDAYYQNAQRRALEGIDAQAASRGAYGSSAALDQGNEAITNLQAAQAGQEADYNLRRLAEQRAWEGLGGDFAGAASADQGRWAELGRGAAFGSEEADLARQLAGTGIANQLDANTRARLGLMLESGLGGQQAREGRIGGMFSDLMAIPSMSFGPTMGAFGDTFDQQDALFDADMNAALGIPAAYQSELARRGALKESGIGNLAELYKTYQSGGFSAPNLGGSQGQSLGGVSGGVPSASSGGFFGNQAIANGTLGGADLWEGIPIGYGG